MTRDQKKALAGWQRWFMRAGWTFDILTRPFMKLTIDQKAPFPSAPVLLAANHRSVLDVFVALICCYRLGLPTRFIVGRVFFKRPPLGLFLRAIGCIEGGRGSGADRVAIEALERGESCAIMPEGAVMKMEEGHVLAPLLPGVASIWSAAGCGFVAVGISGAGEVWRKDHKLPRLALRPRNRVNVHVRVTEAIYAGNARADLERVTEIMETNCRQSDADRALAIAA